MFLSNDVDAKVASSKNLCAKKQGVSFDSHLICQVVRDLVKKMTKSDIGGGGLWQIAALFTRNWIVWKGVCESIHEL